VENMKRSLKIGFSFGLTSAIITTLGLMVGLHSSTDSRFVVIGGILTIAIADAFAEAMGVHASKKCENHVSIKEVWETTFFTFVCKFLFTSMFIIPILIFNLHEAIIFSILLGFYLLIVLSIYIARERDVEPWKMVLEHLSIIAVVILLAHFAGQLIHMTFGKI
jgi:vacuolar iron transporter family protein